MRIGKKTESLNGLAPFLGALVLAGCGATANPPLAEDGSTKPDAGTVAAALTARCVYKNRSSVEECREYPGADWTAATAATDCAASQGTFTAGSACQPASTLGQCNVGDGTALARRAFVSGSDSHQCAIAKRDCVIYAGGQFLAADACAAALPTDSAAGGLSVFNPPSYRCVDPKAGAPAGKGPSGQVCTWSAISASTEEGRDFASYAECEKVVTQRPYYPVPANTPPADPDPRLHDAKYMTELNWVKSQIEASACVCCHSEKVAPRGHSQWYLEAPNNFMNSFFDSGLALGANYRDSSSFGAYAPADDNGFDRIHSGFPSTDPQRMVAFFVAELAHRGKTQADFAGAPPFGGPLVSERNYKPVACKNGEGVAGTGKVNWVGGPARYVYVMASGSENPVVPPNMDLPSGTIWRVDVPFDGKPMRTGEVSYGVVPEGVSQKYPVAGMGAAAALEVGKPYYLYVLADVGVPVTRCLFTR